ncbi:quinolinate synthase NadA [Pelotomaculum terephthalicicum JT]|uniref:quinolinate synthase NadA n=1 Tax=Pelotomaculum TaxID=191373 RepID=UPI0009D5BD9F|nr:MULTISPECIES: quinolinate synthase NadA [Pelotomaculum]MCG9968286.1 quinolinate synthase NadA [Pelotomaculum terephthalicicum JT]OPX89509.1 MAG: Quinolinate synthase A [Pelotomaculum sp. PtaB.Bin117]OPY63266.1 MAG: Quinolinate synthase A [Pelotomaculum sp. PtaU1.Bin065]
MQDLSEEIIRLKKERNAVILSHLYQRPEVQDIADFVGDSLGLAQQAAGTDADVIIFCGVHFMAESASILSPEKIVVLPDEHAGCPMADMVDEVALARKKQEMPDAVVVCYVNTSAEVKAECDIACTSANAERVINSLPEDKPILFVPDKNLGRYVASKTGRAMTVWEGCCNTHDRLAADDLLAARASHPAALIMVHPECRPEAVALADVVASTTGMINFARASSAHEFIVGTEMGILHPLRKHCPDKQFYLASDKLVCPNMKKTTLEKVRQALISLAPRVDVPREIRERAVRCLDKMLAV